ncbi:MAG TPA: hypothetical protein VKB35_08415 [Ktedonobacteraceae bacterium]|nr:hypothetical protein [Ktedonobacteraceae bacterium]
MRPFGPSTKYSTWSKSHDVFTGAAEAATSEPPAEVIRAVCDLYGLSPERIASIQAEKLSTLSSSLWAITLNERASAVVIYEPGAMEQPVATPWFEERD